MTDTDVITEHLASAVSSLDGCWENQLGSKLVIAVAPDGRLSGEYRGAAGALAGQAYPLTGSAGTSVDGLTTPLGFVVRWDEAHCVTTWCGQYVDSPVEEIRAIWLLTSPVVESDSWKATVTGFDVFRRT